MHQTAAEITFRDEAEFLEAEERAKRLAREHGRELEVHRSIRDMKAVFGFVVLRMPPAQ
jgi:hypothetical protein